MGILWNNKGFNDGLWWLLMNHHKSMIANDSQRCLMYVVPLIPHCWSMWPFAMTKLDHIKMSCKPYKHVQTTTSKKFLGAVAAMYLIPCLQAVTVWAWERLNESVEFRLPSPKPVIDHGWLRPRECYWYWLIIGSIVSNCWLLWGFSNT